MLTRFAIWILSLFGYDSRWLFRYWDGRRWRFADPLAATRGLFSFPNFDWDDTPNLMKSGMATIQLESLATVAAAVRSVFGIPAVEKGGLTELECFELLMRFRSYLGDVKKNGSLFPISPDSTESMPSSGEVELGMRPASGSGSIAKEPSTEPHGLPAEQTLEGSLRPSAVP